MICWANSVEDKLIANCQEASGEARAICDLAPPLGCKLSRHRTPRRETAAALVSSIPILLRTVNLWRPQGNGVNRLRKFAKFSPLYLMTPKRLCSSFDSSNMAPSSARYEQLTITYRLQPTTVRSSRRNHSACHSPSTPPRIYSHCVCCRS